MELDMNGRIVRDHWASCWPLRQFLNNAVFVSGGGKGIVYAGGPEGLMRYEICVGDGCYSNAAASSSTASSSSTSSSSSSTPELASTRKVVATTSFTSRVAGVAITDFSQ